MLLEAAIKLPRFRATKVSREKLADIIRESELHRVLISIGQGCLRKYPSYLKIDSKPYWDGIITNPNETNFDFRLLYGYDQPVVVLQYRYVNGLLIPRKVNSRFIDPLIFRC